VADLPPSEASGDVDPSGTEAVFLVLGGCDPETFMLSRPSVLPEAGLVGTVFSSVTERVLLP
jgi:hypothetical protein